jgi:hypothetical protein
MKKGLGSHLRITDRSLDVGYNLVFKFIEAFKKPEGQLLSDYRLEKLTEGR